MKTTVQALLNVLVGRDPNEVVMIENNELRIVATINLLGAQEPTPQIICNADTKTDPVLRAAVNPEPPVGDVKVETRGRPRKAEDDPKSPYVKRTTQNVANGNRAWQVEDITLMAGLRAKGVSFHDIGKVFGRTARAIECQLHYLRHPEARPTPKPRVVPADSNSVQLM